jgi:uridine phosphorylase
MEEPIISTPRKVKVLSRNRIVVYNVVANRIICVGDLGRAKLYSTLLQKIYFCHPSHRGFVTFTGLYNNKPVSIIGTGMV